MSIKREIIDNNHATCRHCEIPCKKRDDVISPCHCKHHRKWVHPACLDRFRTTRIRDRDFFHCATCDYDYRLKPSRASLKDLKSIKSSHINRERMHAVILLRDFFLGKHYLQNTYSGFNRISQSYYITNFHS